MHIATTWLMPSFLQLLDLDAHLAAHMPALCIFVGCNHPIQGKHPTWIRVVTGHHTLSEPLQNVQMDATH